MIQRQVQDVIAMMILKNEVREEQEIAVDANPDGQLLFEIVK